MVIAKPQVKQLGEYHLGVDMEEHECPTCGHKYEKKPQNIRFEDLPEKWRCPICNVPKNDFIPKTPKKK